MKSVLFCFLASLLFAACYSPQLNCKKYKTGIFEYQSYLNGELIKARIVRNDSLEIDYYDEKQPDTSKIRWVNDCEYILRKYHPKNRKEKQSFQIQIISTTKDSYTFEFSKVGESQKSQFTAKRVE